MLKYYIVLYKDSEGLDVQIDTLYVGKPNIDSTYEVAMRFTNFFLDKIDDFVLNKRIKNVIKTEKEIRITYTEMNNIENKVFRAELQEVTF